MNQSNRAAHRQRILATASMLALLGIPARHPLAAGDQTAQVNPGLGQAAAAPAAESIVVKQRRRLLKEKNSPSAVTELGHAQIEAVGVAGSTAQLLRQAPSVYVYQQGLGDNAPELTVRGLRGLEIASTLDGVPTQDLLAPGSSYLSNNIGGVFTLGQISGVSIYPGVAYPDRATFGTIGGTIAYSTKRPSNDFTLDVDGSIGSFGTYKEGFELNSGALDSSLGTGDNAIKLLLNYQNLQTQGFIDGTPNRENEMEFALDKPFDDGLSKFQATIIYNTGDGLIQNEPVPVPYLQKYGLFSNYPTNLVFASQRNDYLTIILKDDTYVNDYLNVGITAFYIHNDNTTETYNNIAVTPPTGYPNPLGIGGSAPFINNPAGFGFSPYYGPGGDLYLPGVYPYNPLAAYPPGSKACPQYLVNEFKAAGEVPGCGLNAFLGIAHPDTYGIQPRATIIVPTIAGIDNTIHIGALIAKETQPIGQSYAGGYPDVPQTPQNLVNEFGGGFDGGVERTIYQAYAQDKIDLLDNSLHVTPGATLEGTYSSFKQSYVFGGTPSAAERATPYCAAGNPCLYGAYKAKKWDREFLPFLNVTYDFDKILPSLAGLSAYGSYGESALFAPVTDFAPNTAGPPPYASIVHMYEGGLKYNTSNLLLSADYFYQKVDRDFGFFTYQSGPDAGLNIYSSIGQREIKGIEAAATWQLTPQVQLFANFSHLLDKYLTSTFAFVTVAEDQFGIAEKGAPATGVPDNLATFGIDYERKAAFLDNDDANIRLTGQYTGHQYTTYDITGNAIVPNFPQLSTNPAIRYSQLSGATVYDPNGGINPFVVFSLDASYKLPTPQLPVMKSVTFDLNIQNLFDEHYYQYYYKQISPSNCPGSLGPYGCTPEFADAIPGQPFSVFFTVTARF